MSNSALPLFIEEELEYHPFLRNCNFIALFIFLPSRFGLKKKRADRNRLLKMNAPGQEGVCEDRRLLQPGGIRG